MMSTMDDEHNLDVDLDQVHDALIRLRNGDFSTRLPTTWEHRAGLLARVFNSLAEMLQALSGEVIRVTTQTGRQGHLGAQAEVNDVPGRWGEMIASVNDMASVLTYEVRLTSTAARAWAEGDTNHRLTPRYISGEFAEMQQHLDTAAQRWTDAPGE
jgi:methyl-accepting chemotaxis protein